MRADDSGFVRTELIENMLAAADEMGDSPNLLLAVTGSWVRREAHLAEARHLAMIQDGILDDSARFLAMDDMGFQLAQAAVEGWSTPQKST